MLLFEEFDQIVSAVKEKDRELADISNMLGGAERLYQISMCDETLSLLKHIFNDEDGWIEYWMWELDFGEKWREGSVTDADGKDIRLQSSADLYQLLINNTAQQEGEN